MLQNLVEIMGGDFQNNWERPGRGQMASSKIKYAYPLIQRRSDNQLVVLGGYRKREQTNKKKVNWRNSRALKTHSRGMKVYAGCDPGEYRRKGPTKEVNRHSSKRETINPSRRVPVELGY